MIKLVNRIKEEFSSNAVIEIYILDEVGVPCELYSGIPNALQASFFEDVYIILYSVLCTISYYILCYYNTGSCETQHILCVQRGRY
jgi:hypothetical protein